MNKNRDLKASLDILAHYHEQGDLMAKATAKHYGLTLSQILNMVDDRYSKLVD